MSLSADLLREIAGTAAEVACKMALVCVEWRSAVQAGVGGSFDVRHGLLCLDETALMGELTVALALSPTTVKLAPHKRKPNRYGGCYNIFTHATAVELFRQHGGWTRLEARLARRATRQLRGRATPKKKKMKALRN
tara:strand:- start:272 stop:679 length:408 start_codon:yes stop_codon:yes gene_type:complete